MLSLVQLAQRLSVCIYIWTLLKTNELWRNFWRDGYGPRNNPDL